LRKLEGEMEMERRCRKLFGEYDIRGVVGEDLDSATVRAIARAFGDYLSPKRPGRFLIGHDARWSSPALAEAVSVGLRESGHSVTHIGLASTPLVYWYGAEAGFDGSVAISASHLPSEYNGLKLCRRSAVPLSGDSGLPKVAALLGKHARETTSRSNETLRREAPLVQYAAQIGKRLKPEREIKIAVDAGNGMGGIEADAMFLHSGSEMVRLWRLNFYLDGAFPVRPSNPLAEGALAQLSAIVKNNSLDFGLAFDGDADRAVLVDEAGRMVPPDAVGGLIALSLLKAHPGATILHDLRSSRALPELILAAGGRAQRSRVGHAFIKRAMRQQKAVFAMELSGHYYYRDLHYTDNALRTLIEMINIVSAADKPLSQLVRPFERYPTSGEINLKVANREAVLQALEAKYRNGHVDHLDGLSVDYSDWWFNVRPSQTEPVLRLNIGAATGAQLEQKRAELVSAVTSQR
jgi:phosphomannomutase